MIELVLHPDERLRHTARRVVSFDASLTSLAADMLNVMRSFGAVGIAAPQVGDGRSVIIVDPGRRSPVVLVNPTIVWSASRSDVDVEGCLSLPGVELVVMRPVSCVVRFHDVAGNERVLRYDGWPARIVQHELDHLVGTLMLDRVDELTAIVARGKVNASPSVVQR